jgi:hypothetical protein
MKKRHNLLILLQKDNEKYDTQIQKYNNNNNNNNNVRILQVKLNPELPWQKQTSTRMGRLSPENWT